MHKFVLFKEIFFNQRNFFLGGGSQKEFVKRKAWMSKKKITELTDYSACKRNN